MGREYPQRINTRLKGFDYARNGCFFITFCVKDKHCLLGKIQDGCTVLSRYGIFVHDEIIRTATIRPNIIVDHFIVMPNHVHLFIKTVGVCCVCPRIIENDRLIDTEGEALGINGGECNSPIQSPSQTIGSVVRGIKCAATHKIGFSLFQRGYYDSIIRDEQVYQKVYEYIEDNPSVWQRDKYYCAQNIE